MTESAQSLVFGSFTLDPAERLLLKEGRVVPLTPKAFDLLAVMVRNAGRLLSKDELMEKVWPDAFIEESNLAYNVFTIRKALGEDSGGGRYIETIPRRGYRFVAPIALIDSDVRDGEAPTLAPVATEPGVENASEGSAPFIGPAIEEPGLHSPRNPGPDPATIRARRPWLSWSAAGASLIALAALALVHFGEKVASPNRIRSVIPLVIRLLESNPFSVSPDGRHLAFSGIGPDGIARLWVQDLETLDARQVPGTESRIFTAPPFWSPDSAFIAYGTVGQLMKVSVSGGAPQPICQLPDTLAVGGAWRGSVIVIGSSVGGLLRCAASGGPSSQASLITTPSSGSANEIHIFPSFLPDGQHFLYTRVSRTAPENSGVFVGSLADPPTLQNADRLLETGFGAAYVAGVGSAPGRILFVRNSALLAQTFDPRRLKLAGDPIPVAAAVGSYLDYAFFSVSANGVLIFKAPDPDVQLTWLDRQGNVTGLVGKPGRYTSVALSPDGTRAVAVKQAPQSTADQDLWWFDLSRDGEAHKLTFGPVLELSPIWAGDSDRVVFSSGGGQSGVYEIAVNGTQQPRQLFRTGRTEFPFSVSPNSGVLLFGDDKGPTGRHLWARTTGGNDHVEPHLFLSREHDQVQGQFSPDGQWVAYVSNESGPDEVFVASSSPDPATGSATAGPGQQISKDGGGSPRWCRNGRELFYLAPDGAVMVLDIRTDRGGPASVPRKLFQAPEAPPDWGVSPDGKRFLFAVPVSSPPPFSVILNWDVGLKE